MKKYLLALLMAISCLCLGLAFGCQPDDANDGPFNVQFVAADNLEYSCDYLSDGGNSFTVEKGTSVAFSLVYDAEEYENPRVTVNGSLLVALSDGTYSVTVNADVKIAASVSARSNLLSGEGTEENPYKISTVRDLRIMADRINGGTPSYVLGYYSLQNDIDCGGATLDVIGNFNSSTAYFAGIFEGNGNTISNYRIETRDVSYVGLFGCVQPSGNSDDLSGIIQNLNLDNFVIDAHALSGSNICVGSFAGYAAGANIVVCNATNGKINVDGNDYFSYAGGAVGIQQSVTISTASGLNHFLSSIDYVHTDVDINATGVVFGAGGIVGYMYSSHERAAATVINSYSEGFVMGAMRSGGIAGWMGEYASIANCYSTSEVSAFVNLPQATDNAEYYAYAGGIAGYAGLSSVITDSFFSYEVEPFASAINSGKATGGVCGGYEPKTAMSENLVVYNSYSFDNKDGRGTSASFISGVLHWSGVDWIIRDGSYPVVNTLTQTASTFTVTLDFSGKNVSGSAQRGVALSITGNSYAPLSFYIGTEFSEYVTADDGFVSYGYYFDSECNDKVPYGYVPTRDITLYIGFADYGEVADTYYYTANGRTVTLTLDNKGACYYVDGVSHKSNYVYDGKSIVFKEAIFARLSDVVTVTTVTDGDVSREVPQPALNFEAYVFAGEVKSGVLTAYDGTYFTESDPVRFTVNEPSTADIFRGVWEKSATVNKVYTFDGAGNWTLTYKGNLIDSGTYTVGANQITLGGKTATIDESGLLDVGGELFCLQGSLFGTWYSSESSAYLMFNGYGAGLSGYARAVVGFNVYDLTYVMDGFFGEGKMTLLSGYSLFGNAKYNAETGLLEGEIYNTTTGRFVSYTFRLVDNYTGEWIGEGEVSGVAFTIADFNGLGLYKPVTGANATNSGFVTINGQRVAYECNVENGLEGAFTYNGVPYTLKYNEENGTVEISSGSETAEMVRKDEMYSITLTDGTGAYTFNGGGKLLKGGVLTYTPLEGAPITYGYKIVGGGTVDGRNLVISVLNAYNGTEVGQIVIEYPKFVLKMNGQSDVVLDMRLPFTGTWAISEYMRDFEIGNFDLGNTATGRFTDMSNATFTYLPESNMVLLRYINEKLTSSVPIYLIMLSDGNIAVSSYPYLVSSDLMYACRSDEMYGTWDNLSDSSKKLAFDGLADSAFTVGVAFDGATFYNYTRRFGKLFMWKSDDESVAYVITRTDFTGVNESDIYGKDTRFNRFALKSFDILNAPVFTATDGSGVEYKFKLDGTVTFGDVSGKYELDSVSNGSTRLVISVDGEEDVYVTVDHTTGVLEFVY